MATRRTAQALGLGLLATCWILVSPALAQWMPNGVPVCTAPGDQLNPRVASDGSGGAIVVWRDLRDYFTRDFDVYAQRVTSAGVIPLGWPPDGIPICTDSAYQDLPDIASDGAGGAYVVWIDQRDYTTNLADVYIQRVTPQGVVAPGWVANGNPVCAVAGDVDLPRVAPDGVGGAFVVWEDFRRSTYRGDRTQVDLYAQRITPEGKVAPGWPVDGLSVCTAPGERCCVTVMPDGQGGLFIEWADGRSLASSGSDIYALRINAQGAVAPGWTADGVAICTAPGHQNLAGVAPDSQGGFIVAWVDGRTAPPDEVNFEDYYDIYAQRVTASGTIAAGWPENGVPLCTAPELQWDLEVVPDGAGGAVVAWVDYRNRFTTASDLYAQRVLASGGIAPGWPTDGVPLSRHPRFQLAPTMVDDGAGGALVAYETGGGDNDVYVQHVTSSGALAPGWDPDGVRLSSLPHSWSPAAVSDGMMGMIVAWEDDRSLGGTDIYAQRVGGEGPTPVQISLVSVEAMPDRVTLTWHRAAGAVSDATIYRRRENEDWAALARTVFDGRDRLRYEDRTVAPGARYAYRLGWHEAGIERLSAEVWVEVPAALRLALEGPRPNPAVGALDVVFTLPREEPATLELLDVRGRRVLAREVGTLGPGRHVVRLAETGHTPPGVYWLRLTQATRSDVQRAVVVR